MKNSVRIGAMFIALLAVVSAKAQDLVHYWNFNNSETLESLTAPSSGGGSIAIIPGGISAVQITSNTGQNFDLENLNTRNSDLAATHLRFNDPIGGALVFSLPTNGYKDAVVKYVTRRSGSGAGLQYVGYTTNGVDFTGFDTVVVTETPTLISLDFSSVAEANNNPAFAIQFSFAAGWRFGIYDLKVQNLIDAITTAKIE